MLSASTRVRYILHLCFLTSTISAQGQIAQFLDLSCEKKSPINPTVSLPLNTCLVIESTQEGANGAEAVIVQVLPACPPGSSNPTLQLYQDQSCATPASNGDTGSDCLWILSDIDVPAVMFICGSVADGDSHATSTTTVSAGLCSCRWLGRLGPLQAPLRITLLPRLRLVRMGL